MDTQPRDFTITTVGLSVHRQGDSPTCGDSVYLVKLEDNGAGPYVVVEDLSGLGKHDGVAIDLEELPVLLEALKQIGEIAAQVEIRAEPKP